MKFIVTITKDGQQIKYPAIGNAFDLHAAAIEEHGPCSVSVMRQP